MGDELLVVYPERLAQLLDAVALDFEPAGRGRHGLKLDEVAEPRDPVEVDPHVAPQQ